MFDRWAILFSHPADYTPVCTTELGKAAALAPEFQKRGVKMIGFSIDNVESHNGWIKVCFLAYIYLGCKNSLLNQTVEYFSIFAGL